MAEVLVVDAGELGELLTALFEQYGITASHARNASEALARARVDPPRVVVVEHDLPDGSGLDVADAVRAELPSRVILTYPLGLTSGTDDGDEALLERIAALDASFPRPFRSLALVEAAARLMHIALPRPGALGLQEAEPAAERAFGVEPNGVRGPSPLLDGIVWAKDVLGASEAPAEHGDATLETLDDGALVDVELDEHLRPSAADIDAAFPLDVRRAPAAPPSAPRPRPGPTVSTSALSPRALAKILDAFHQSQTTGELWLESGNGKRVLLLRRGVLSGARSNIETEDLLALAVRRRLLDGETATRLVADAHRAGLSPSANGADEGATRAKKTGVHLLLLSGLFGEGDRARALLRPLVEEHVRRVALGAFAWRTGTYRVALEGHADREPIPAGVRVGDVVVHGTILVETDAALVDAAPDDARFAPLPDASYPLHDLGLSAEEARIVVAMDGTKTIRDLLLLFEGTAPRIVRGLAASLADLGVVRIAGMGQAQARRISYF
jgi:CheY-like chemotaxis protein